MPRSNRLAGHALPDEGRVRDQYGRFTPTGPATCSCGATSEALSSDSARKKWHKGHKDDVRARRA